MTEPSPTEPRPTGRPTVTVVGGGITGLAAAWELSAHDELDITVLEAGPRFGGKIATTEFAGRRVDEGADTFLRRVPEAIDLCDELGLDDLTSPASGSAFVWTDGALRRIPGGLVLGVPAHFDELDRSDILTAQGRARARLEPEIEGAPLQGDCSVAELIDARFGPEVTRRLVEPLIGGIYAGTADRLSLDAVLPQLAEIAHSSAVLSTPLAEREASPGTQGPVFSAPLAGMGSLIDTLVDGLTTRGVHLVSGRAADALPASDAVIVATPAPVAARLVAALRPAAATLLEGIEYASVVLLTLAFHRAEVGIELDGSGFLVPRDAGLLMTAASWATTKWAHLVRPDDDLVILRVSVGHREDSRPETMTDDELVMAARGDLRLTMGIDAAPSEVRISRYLNGFPQYDVGHLDRVARIDALLESAAPHVIVTGSAHRGLGIPACIRQGRAAGRVVAARLLA